MKLARVLAFGLFMTGCEPDPWQTFPSSVAPDQECRTGTEQGYDVYLWHCHEHQRIAIFRRCSALTGCAPTERQSVSCSETTPIERDLKLKDQCDPIPATMRWVSRKPEGS